MTLTFWAVSSGNRLEGDWCLNPSNSESAMTHTRCNCLEQCFFLVQGRLQISTYNFPASTTDTNDNTALDRKLEQDVVCCLLRTRRRSPFSPPSAFVPMHLSLNLKCLYLYRSWL